MMRAFFITLLVVMPLLALSQQKVFKYYPIKYTESYLENGKWTKEVDSTTDYIKNTLIVTDFERNKVSFYSENGVREVTIVKYHQPLMDNEELFICTYICVDHMNNTCKMVLFVSFKKDGNISITLEYPSIRMNFILRNA